MRLPNSLSRGISSPLARAFITNGFPPRAGAATKAPIVYRSVPEHAAIVRGTDVLDANWQPVTDAPGVFTAPLPQAAFVFGNPFVRPPEPSKKKPKW